MTEIQLFKLTTQDLKTYGDTVWTPGEWREAPGEGELCAAGWIHVYEHPLLAVALNPIHAGIEDPRLWEVEVGGRTKSDLGLKFGVQRCRVTRELEVPSISVEALTHWAIELSLHVYEDTSYVTWARKWLSGEDRSRVAAWAAAWAARAEAAATWAARAAATWAARAAEAAAEAAEAAARAKWAAEAAAEAVEARAEAAATWAAAEAAEAAARAAETNRFSLIESLVAAIEAES